MSDKLKEIQLKVAGLACALQTENEIKNEKGRIRGLN